jgi:pimeloyl-ACP methyl ester carboxylesterase
VSGDGPRELVFVHGVATPIDLVSEDPGFLRIRRRLDTFSRTVWFDPRGRGASEGDPKDSFTGENFDADLTAVLDAVGFAQPAMVGAGISSPLIHFSVTHPERVSALVLVNSFAHYVREDDYPWGAPPDSLDRLVSAVKENWGWAQRWRSLPRAAWPTSASEPGSPARDDSEVAPIRSAR